MEHKITKLEMEQPTNGHAGLLLLGVGLFSRVAAWICNLIDIALVRDFLGLLATGLSAVSLVFASLYYYTSWRKNVESKKKSGHNY